MEQAQLLVIIIVIIAIFAFAKRRGNKEGLTPVGPLVDIMATTPNAYERVAGAGNFQYLTLERSDDIVTVNEISIVRPVPQVPPRVSSEPTRFNLVEVQSTSFSLQRTVNNEVITDRYELIPEEILIRRTRNIRGLDGGVSTTINTDFSAEPTDITQVIPPPPASDAPSPNGGAMPFEEPPVLPAIPRIDIGGSMDRKNCAII